MVLLNDAGGGFAMLPPRGYTQWRRVPGGAVADRGRRVYLPFPRLPTAGRGPCKTSCVVT